jgi:DNA-binding CsgD family transcriptional regulator
VKAAISIIRRHRLLGRSPALPLGAFRNADAKICTIRGKHMEKHIQNGCRHAYPDPAHYLRMRIKLLQSHSIRIFACVALLNAGESVEDIAYRLCWNSDAVKQYIRDCHRLVDHMTQQALLGAFHDERSFATTEGTA